MTDGRGADEGMGAEPGAEDRAPEAPAEPASPAEPEAAAETPEPRDAEAPEAAPEAPETRDAEAPEAEPGTSAVPLPPPPPDGGIGARRFDGGDGPLLPPPPPWVRRAPVAPPVTEALLAIPLGPRRLVGQALDLLTRSDSGLRSASFYIGFLLLATVGPAVALLGIALVVMPGDPFGRPVPGNPAAYRQAAWTGWFVLAAIPAYLGFLAAGVEARALAAAVIGGRAEGRPLRLRESIAIARRRFWSILGAQVLIGILSSIVSFAIGLAVGLVVRNEAALSFAITIAVGLVIGAPFVYVPAGIVLGEAPAMEAIRRSIRLARTRKRLAVVVTLFTVFSQVLVLLGASAGADVVYRLGSGSGLLDAFPVPLVVPVVAALVFAFGTLQFLVEAIAAAPAVHAFEALTHYTAGLEQGRREPLAIRHWWDPWFTPGLTVCTVIALLGLVAGVLTLRP